MGESTGMRILVCDDEPHIVHVVAAKLRNAGFEVITAENGEEALELATREPPALVVTDLQMPYLNGLELAQRMRAEPATSGVPLILLTARGFSLDESEWKCTNIREVMCKPFSPREILGKVQALLSCGAATDATDSGRARET